MNRSRRYTRTPTVAFRLAWAATEWSSRLYPSSVPKVTPDHLAARRRQIIDAARGCFARYGYEGATVRRLEAATGLSRGAIFHHFTDKETLFLAIAHDDAERMAEVVARDGLVQVMRDLVEQHQLDLPDDAEVGNWLGTRLEVARRLRTDPDFRARWEKETGSVAAATSERLHRQRDAGRVRDDVPEDVLSGYLELVLEGVISRLAAGLPTAELTEVLDLVERTVRR